MRSGARMDRLGVWPIYLLIREVSHQEPSNFAMSVWFSSRNTSCLSTHWIKGSLISTNIWKRLDRPPRHASTRTRYPNCFLVSRLQKLCQRANSSQKQTVLIWTTGQTESDARCMMILKLGWRIVDTKEPPKNCPPVFNIIKFLKAS